MISTDYNIIVSATPLYPDIMIPNAEATIKLLFDKVKNKQTELHKARALVNQLENELVELQCDFDQQAALFDIQYGKKEFKEINNTVLTGIINSDDYRNKH